jgi:ureidoacrylate peracid hydrolase
MREVGGIRFFSDLAEIVAPQHTALLVVDMQNDFVSAGGHFARHGRDVSRIQAVIPAIRELLAAARRAGVLIIYTQQLTLPYLASDTPAWVYFKTRDGKTPDYTMRGTWGADFVEELAPPTDVQVIEKFRPSAFHRTSLDEALRAHGIQSVVVAGCLTQGCVQATVTDASYHDYYAVVVKDAVQSTSAPLHDNALAFLGSRYDLISVSKLAGLWPAREAS